MFNKISIDAEVDAHFYKILENYPCFWVCTRCISFRTSKEHVKLFSVLRRERSKFKTDHYQMQIDLWQTVCLPLKKVLHTEFSRHSSCDLLKSNLSCTYEAPNFFLNSATPIKQTNSTGFKYLKLNKDMCRKKSSGLLKFIV